MALLWYSCNLSVILHSTEYNASTPVRCLTSFHLLDDGRHWSKKWRRDSRAVSSYMTSARSWSPVNITPAMRSGLASKAFVINGSAFWTWSPNVAPGSTMLKSRIRFECCWLVYYSAPGRGAEYCDEYICLSVCLFLSCPDFTKFSVRFSCGISILVDDIIFFHTMDWMAAGCYGSSLSAVSFTGLLHGIGCVVP